MTNMNTGDGLMNKIDSVVFYIAKLHGIKDIKLEDRKFAVLWLKNNLRGLEVTEVAKAAEMALNGQIEVFTQLYGNVSPKYLAELLKKYRAYTKELNKQRQLKAPLLVEPKKSKDEINKMMFAQVIDIFNDYKKGKGLPVRYHHIFNFMWSHGMPKMDNTVIEEIRQEAKRDLDVEGELEKQNATDVYQMRQIIKKYTNIVDKAIFKNRCREIYLKRFFDDLIDMDEELTNFINL